MEQNINEEEHVLTLSFQSFESLEVSGKLNYYQAIQNSLIIKKMQTWSEAPSRIVVNVCQIFPTLSGTFKERSRIREKDFSPLRR